MVQEFIKQWDDNKHLLEEYFTITPQSKYSCYKDIVKKIFELVITKQEFDISKLTVIDDGDYQGTQLFIIPLDTYQPSKSDYVITDNEYGSCSGCDTLQGINNYENGLPNKEQVKEYMTLSLHLIQKLKWL